jgi:four helix bundle protein
MDRQELQSRTKKFHVDVIKLCEDFPRNAAGFETAKQLIRSAGSVGANYRASVRAKSPRIFYIRLKLC